MTNQENKSLVEQFWRVVDLDHSQADSLARYLHRDVVWHGHAPIGDLNGLGSFREGFLAPLHRAFGGLKRETHLFFGGQSSGRVDGTGDGKMWVTGTGLLHGVFANDYLSIPASGRPVSIRWGEFCKIEDGKIVEIFFLLDLIDLMQQAGHHVLPPARGKDGVYPGPAAADGIMRDVQDDRVSAYSLQHIRTFIFDGLNNYDQSNLKSMGMADFFHQDVKWYGPGGIGACLSFNEFELLHQQPWLHAFPDRAVQDLDALFAEGQYSGGPGWSGVKATHTGQYLDCPATGNDVVFNGLDWWKREGETYVENWVFVDMIHLFGQFGVDLLERSRSA